MTTEIVRIPRQRGANPFAHWWTPDGSACEICGRRFPDNMAEAEMFHPAERHAEHGSVLCHSSCGQGFGMVPA